MVLLTPPVWLHDSGSSKAAASSKFGWWYFVRSKITSPKDGTQTSHLILSMKVGRKNCQHAPKCKFWILYLILTDTQLQLPKNNTQSPPRESPTIIVWSATPQKKVTKKTQKLATLSCQTSIKYHPHSCLAKDMAPTFDRPHLIPTNQLQQP